MILRHLLECSFHIDKIHPTKAYWPIKIKKEKSLQVQILIISNETQNSLVGNNNSCLISADYSDHISLTQEKNIIISIVKANFPTCKLFSN